jgi:hypothetical protein
VTVTLREELPIPPFSDQGPQGEVRGVRVRQEVWQSLLSMLRVYAYAASLSNGEMAVTETAPHAASLEHKDHTLVLSFDVRSGKGSCHFPGSAQAPGDFEILEDGLLRFAGVEKQLDEAAIDWVEQLTRAAVG